MAWKPAAAAPASTARRRPASTIRRGSPPSPTASACMRSSSSRCWPRLSSVELPALAGLATREDGDFTIALCDALATTLDVLSFYQERIANENYLRTATERRSILELAQPDRLRAGARASPASTYLAFTLPGGARQPGAGGRPGRDPRRHQGAERARARASSRRASRLSRRSRRAPNGTPSRCRPRSPGIRSSATPSSGSPASAAGCSAAMRYSSWVRTGIDDPAASAGTSACSAR